VVWRTQWTLGKSDAVNVELRLRLPSAAEWDPCRSGVRKGRRAMRLWNYWNCVSCGSNNNPLTAATLPVTRLPRCWARYHQRTRRLRLHTTAYYCPAAAAEQPATAAMRSVLYTLLSLATLTTALAIETAAPKAKDDDWEEKQPDTIFNGQSVPPMIELGPTNLDTEISKGNW
jgi:predicted RNA-binding Zn-ribbon protein involved in translation (DUF1610 family)